MKKLWTKMAAALVLGSAVVAVAPADARRDGRWDRGDRWDNYRGDRHWRGDRDWRGDRHWRGDGYRRGDRGYYGPRDYYAPRYYGYGYGYPSYRHYYRDRDGGDIALGALAGIAIGAAIAAD